MEVIDQSAAQIKKVLKLSRDLMALADEGLAICTDDGCLLLNSLVRDYACRIHDAADKEMAIHRDQGTGDREPSGPARL